MKPLDWKPDPRVGYTVVRRPDGGMHFTFTDVSHETLMHWREFALSHLAGAEGMNRNLYDLRQVKALPEEAVRLAIEVNNDPAARSVRLAILVAGESVAARLQEIAALSLGAEISLFTDSGEAEAWLNRPFSPVLRRALAK
ncbi:MAG: hypothetical protein HY260_17470 [Chloroflexi bacterium]|nr:hypothetical protein [Chloroflexota bacterium]